MEGRAGLGGREEEGQLGFEFGEFKYGEVCKRTHKIADSFVLKLLFEEVTKGALCGNTRKVVPKVEDECAHVDHVDNANHFVLVLGVSDGESEDIVIAQTLR